MLYSYKETSILKNVYVKSMRLIVDNLNVYF